MKRLKPKQLGPWCSYCAEHEVKTRAVYVGKGWKDFACNEHVESLTAQEHADDLRESRMTEADYQTWGRL